MKYRITFILSALVFLLASVSSSEAASLTFVSDTISTSVPSVVANHTISFTTSSGVLANGTIIVTFPAGFTIGSVVFGDMDLKDDASELTLAGTASGTDWGAAFSSQVLTLTNGSTVVAAGSVMELQIGTNAASGSNQITNHASAASYSVVITGTFGDTGTAMIAMILPVSMTTEGDSQSPVANAGPDQTLTDTDDSGSESVTLDGSGSTDADGTISSFVWKEDNIQIATGENPTISLAVGAHAITLTVTDNDDRTGSDGVTIIVNSAGGSSGLAGGGSDFTLPPVGPVTVVSTYGVGTIGPADIGLISISNIDGSSASVSLDAGSVTQGTEITISLLAENVVVSVAPPPAGLDIAGDLVYSLNARTAADDTPVEQFLKPVTVAFAYTDAQIADLDEETLRIYFLNQSLGIWELVPDSKVDADNNTVSGTVSHFTVFAVMGATLRPVPGAGDLNNDSRVDLVDFSILLFNWGVPKDPIADLNKDGKVDLVDFSILLYWWTG